jgi:hypothetical protein
MDFFVNSCGTFEIKKGEFGERQFGFGETAQGIAYFVE